MDESVDRVREVVRRVAPELEGSFSPTADLYRELGVKSVSALDLLLALEEEFGVTLDDEAFGEARTVKKLAAMIAGHASRHHAPKEAIARRTAKPVFEGVHAELVRRGWVIELGRGQLGLAGPALALARTIDADCARIGRERFGANARAYPSLIPASVLARCGYFGSFPHLVSLVAHLGDDLERLETFRAANAGSPSLEIPDRGDLVIDACLAPAVCFHAYHSLEGATLPPEGIAIGCAGRCYRWESSKLVGLERLWDFSMREIVFLGTHDHVIARRQAAIEAVMDQLERFGLGGSIESANDPFFPTTSATKPLLFAPDRGSVAPGALPLDPKTFFQTAADLKFELRLPIGSGKTLAVASFNVHENLFGSAFSIRTPDGKTACTGCTAWGIERYVLACFSQHGFEPADWPDALRGAFKEPA
jgi:acyl carrier protein/seryl-tRNA synthetase